MKLHNDLKKTKTFSDYIEWPKSMLQVQRTNNIAALSAYCETVTNRDKKSHVAHYLNKSVAKRCYQKVLKKLAQNWGVSLKLHKKFNVLIQKQIPHFFQYKLETDIGYFLSRFKKQSNPHVLYSQSFEKYFINEKVTPKVKLLPYINLTSRLTAYLQSVDLNKSGTQKIFLKEFRALSKKALKSSDENTPLKEIQKQNTSLINYVAATYQDQPHNAFSNSYLSYGKSLIRRKYYKEAREVFIDILQREMPNSKKAIFELLWTYTYTHNYSGGLIAIKPFKKLYSSKQDSKMTFWIAFSKYKTGKKKQALKDFSDLIATNPLSYYAILSSKLLSEKVKNIDTKSIYTSYLTEARSPSARDFSKIDYNWLKRVIAWGRVSNSALLSLELEDIISSNKPSSVQKYLLSAAYKLSEKKNYLESFKLIYRFVDRGLLQVNTDVLKLLFPLPFIEQIKNKSIDFDPMIALSLIRQESGFNRFAKSRVGARGLMQLMPATARRLKRSVRTRQLYNSGLNISLGTTYLKKLMSMYDNNLVYSLAAYNAGERRISDWKDRDYVNSEESMLKNIENIPFLETRKYVKLIFRNIFFYKMLTGESAEKDPFKFNRIYDIHVGFNK